MWMKLRNKFFLEYREGVAQFLEVAKFHIDAYGQIRCSCKRCMNSNWNLLEGVEGHLLLLEYPPTTQNECIMESQLALEV